MAGDEVFDYYQEVARSAFADMLHDTERNQKYSLALREAIEIMKKRGKKANVLDIGTGTGLLAMLAARHGADSVVTVESFSPISQIARKIIAENGFGDKIKIVNKHSMKLKVGKGEDLEEKANILVAELLDTELIGEGAIIAYNHAHANLMEKDCICIPDSAKIFVQVVDCQTAADWNTLLPWYTADGNEAVGCPLNISTCLGVPAIHDLQLSQLPLEKFTSVCGPFKIFDVDFSGKDVIKRDERLVRAFKAQKFGRANAVFFWWDIKMNPSGSILLSCAPHWSHPDTEVLAASNSEVIRRNAIPWRDHWMQGCFFVQSALSLKPNGTVVIVAERDEFSWWFNICNEQQADLPTERPFCSCMFHIANSRNRIMQINERSKSMIHKKLINDLKSDSVLFVGDHNVMALFTARIKRSMKVYLLQDDKICRRSLENIAPASDNFMMVNSLKEINHSISCVLAEPHFNRAVLPWDNFTELWKLTKQLKEIQSNKITISPETASIHAVPVHFLNLHKIRWPLKSTCEGFDHKLFDQVVEAASSLTDANVEPFTLWEYPCVALGPAVQIFEMNMNDEIIKSKENSLKIEDFSKACNGIAFWVEYKLDGTASFSCGPSQSVITGELITWKMEERQGVHLIPCSKVEAGSMNGVGIQTQYNEVEEKLQVDFNYFYKEKEL